MAEPKGLHAVVSGIVAPSNMGAAVERVSTVLVVEFRGGQQLEAVTQHLNDRHATGTLELHMSQGRIGAMTWREKR